MRLIDADLLIEWIDAGHLRNPNELCFSEADVVEMIDHMPTIEERKTGEWIHERVNSEHSITGYFILGRCQCSECGVICEQEANFCPNCGADMRGEE